MVFRCPDKGLRRNALCLIAGTVPAKGSSVGQTVVARTIQVWTCRGNQNASDFLLMPSLHAFNNCTA